MKRVVNAVVRIEYEQDDNSYYADMPQEEKDHFAIGLAIQPNFVTEECGIGLRNVHVEPVVPHQIIDWYKLEHNPEQVFINQ